MQRAQIGWWNWNPSATRGVPTVIPSRKSRDDCAQKCEMWNVLTRKLLRSIDILVRWHGSSLVCLLRYKVGVVSFTVSTHGAHIHLVDSRCLPLDACKRHTTYEVLNHLNLKKPSSPKDHRVDTKDTWVYHTTSSHPKPGNLGNLQTSLGTIQVCYFGGKPTVKLRTRCWVSKSWTFINDRAKFNKRNCSLSLSPLSLVSEPPPRKMFRF